MSNKYILQDIVIFLFSNIFQSYRTIEIFTAGHSTGFSHSEVKSCPNFLHNCHRVYLPVATWAS